MRRKVKGVVLAAMAGVLFQFGGCFGDLFGDGFLTDLTRSALYELIWDSDALLDFFGDDGPGLIL